MAQLDAFLNLIGTGRDNALLRFAIGNELMKLGRHEAAVTHLRQAVAWQADYTAAWKLLGRALALAGQVDEAREAYRQGITVAEAHGDIQAAKEMKVFARRLQPSGD